jgi:hypothetical protein
MYKKQIFLTGSVVFFVGVIFGIIVTYAIFTSTSVQPNRPVACTMEAKLCPDGSAVGRTGPNCEFSACPVLSASPKENPKSGLESEKNPFVFSLGQPFTLGKNQIATISDTGLEIEITGFVNSPCPKGAQCFWSGQGINFTYRMKGKIESGINLMQAFGYQAVLGETDYETYANLIVEKI